MCMCHAKQRWSDKLCRVAKDQTSPSEQFYFMHKLLCMRPALTKIVQRSLSFAIRFFILRIFPFNGELSSPVVVCFLINCLSKEEQVLVLSFFDYSVIPESIHLPLIVAVFPVSCETYCLYCLTLKSSL